MFPGPCAAALIGHKCIEAADKEAFGAIRTQPGIDFIQAAGACQYGQPVDDALRKALEPTRTFQRTRSVAHRLCALAVIDKDQIEVGGEAQFLATQAAVTQYGKTGTF